MTAIALGLRVGRWGVLGFSFLSFAITYVQATGFYQLAGHTPAQRAAFASTMNQLASQLTVILPPPTSLDTVSGYVQWRAFGGLAILFAVWALASGTGAARGDEELGLVEAVLATGKTRSGWLASRVTGFAAASLVAACAAGLGLVVGAAAGGESVALGPVVEIGIALTALGLSCYALTIVIAQLASARVATGVAGIVLVTLFLGNTLSRTFTWLVSWRWLSPFHYYELNQPLATGGSFDVRATFTMLAIAVVGAAAAALVFESRDIGASFLRWPASPSAAGYEPSHSPVSGIAVVRGLYERRVGLAMWAAGLAAVGAVFVALTKTVIQPLLSIPTFSHFFGSFGGTQLFMSFLGYLWLTFAELLFAGFAITQVARWASEDTEGRLELILSTPRSRAAVVLERAFTLTVGTAFIAAVSGVAVAIATHYQGVNVSGLQLAEGTLLLVPFALVFAAAGSVLAAWNPRAAVGLLGGLAFASYLVNELGPVFNWPAWIQDLSAFKLFATPLSTTGIDRSGLVIMIAIILVGFAASILLMERRDVGA
jgi:ABC-2 type transport system permease protein